MTETLELLTYRLAPGVTPAAYLKLVDDTRPLIEGQPGLLTRQLACDGENWTEVVRWQSRAQADAAAAAIMADERVAPLMGAIAMDSLTMRFTPLVWPA